MHLQTLAQGVTNGDFHQVHQLATNPRVTSADAQAILMLVANTPQISEKAEKCILYLFNLGANPSALDSTGDTAAHVAARQDNLRVLALLPFNAKWLQNDRGVTPLMEAAQNGSWKCAKHLLHLLREPRYNQKNNDMRLKLLKLNDIEERSALEIAQQAGYPDLANDIELELRLVVDKSGKITGLTSSETTLRTKLMKLALAGDTAGLRQSVTRRNCDLPDSKGHTALMWAAATSKCDDEDLWRLLLQFSDATCADVKGKSCLHKAASGVNCVAASFLLKAGASANARDNTGNYTPLMEAAKEAAADSNAVEVVRVLLDAGSDWSLKAWEKTALDWAAAQERKELVHLLTGFKDKSFFDPSIDLVKSSSTDMAYQTSLALRSPEATQQRSAETLAASISAQKLDSMPQDADFYNVTVPQGLCLIINMNNYTAHSGNSERTGSQRDVERLCRLFLKLRFTVELREDLTVDQLNVWLDEVKGSETLTRHGSFLCFFMAHGDLNFIFDINGRRCEIQTLIAKFESGSCPKLAGKPKVFFIQSCRGSSQDEVVTDAPSSVTVSRQANERQHPAKADFLLCYATTEGYFSYRKPDAGTVYVQTLCEYIEENYKQEDLVHIMTRVNRHMTQNPVQRDGRKYHCVAQKVDQLTSKISLDPNRSCNSVL